MPAESPSTHKDGEMLDHTHEYAGPDNVCHVTPQGEKGMWRKKGDTLLSECIYLMERMFMESLNGVLCQCDDERCKGCQAMWAELRALMDRYDAGER